jgi:large conductance mechanosensitive channel
MSLVKEFRDFARRGNVMDMAVGIIIGGAFGKIVTSFVNDLLMPPIGMLIGGMKFSNLKITLIDAVVNAAGEIEKAAVSINYGNFIQSTVDFLIIAAAIFGMIKFMNSMKRKEEAKPVAPAGPTKEQELLTEIRDLLKK